MISPRNIPFESDASGSKRVRIGSIEDVLKKGWSGKDLLNELIQIDYHLWEGMTSRHEGTIEQWAPVFMDHPDTWRLLLNERDEIVGYWHFVPLFSDSFHKAQEGTLFDSQITSDLVPHLELPGWYDVYFVSVSIMPAYRSVSTKRALFASLENVILELARHDVYFNRICANAYTIDGDSLCRTLGMDFARDHSDQGRIYASNLEALLQQGPLSHNRKLIELYERALVKREHAGRISRVAGIRNNSPNKSDDSANYEALITQGEGPRVEFKSTLRTNLRTDQADEAIELAVLKTIAGFVNTNGGTLFIGVDDAGNAVGLEKDRFSNEDKLSLHLSNLIRNQIGAQFVTYIHTYFKSHQNKRILIVECKKGRVPVFVRHMRLEKFFIRNLSETIELTGNAAQQYIKIHFL